MSDATKQQPLIQSVSRAISILRCFDGKSLLGLSEISRLLGLHKSTTSGIVNTLKAEGFLEQDDLTGKLRLGLGLFSLAVQARRDLTEICDPYLTALLELTGETVNLAVLDKLDIVYIGKKESSHSVRISTSVGTHLPVYCTAIGKVILAFMERSKAEAIVNQIDFKSYTSNTITNKEEFFKAIEKVGSEGIAYDFEEFEDGVICIASPLRNKSGETVAAISVSGPTRRLDENTQEHVVEAIKKVTSQIGGELSRLV